MQTAVHKPRHIRAILVIAIVAIMSALASNTVSADYAGISSAPFDEQLGLPGAAAQRYQGSYLGGTGWVENQYNNAFTLHRSDMIYSNSANVTLPFTNVEIFHNDSFLFRVPSTSFSPDPAFTPAGWHRQGGVSTNYTVSITNNGTVKAIGHLGFILCDGQGCAGGLHLTGDWDLW